MPPDVDNVERWRELAAEALGVAAQMTVPDAKRAMLDVALGYERLAELAEKQAHTEKFIERQATASEMSPCSEQSAGCSSAHQNCVLRADRVEGYLQGVR